VDRFTAFVALVTMAGIAFSFRPISWADSAHGSPFANLVWLVGIGVAASFIAAFGVLLLRASKCWTVRVKRLFSVLKTSFSPDVAIGCGVAMAFGIHLLNFLVVFCFARSLGIEISYPQILLFMPAVLLLVMIPVTVNGHGLREILLIFYFGKLGITLHGSCLYSIQETVIALSALMVANDLLWSLPGGLWYLVRFKSK
jgi:hypothetical protein